MKKQRSSILRPVAWLAVFVLLWLSNLIAGLIFSLGSQLSSMLSRMSDFLFLLLWILGGGTFLSVVITALITVANGIVALGDVIYPSKRAVRYYLLGAFEILGCLVYLIYAACGRVTGGSLFWFCARFIYTILQNAVMMLVAGSAASERREEEYYAALNG